MLEVASPTEQLIELVISLATNIPANEFGMVDHIYRADYLMPALSAHSADDGIRIQERAKVPLYYADGFPTTRSGSLFWDRLDHEGSADFMLFQKYLEMSGTYGYRSIHVLAKELASTHTRRTSPPPENIFLIDVEAAKSEVDQADAQLSATQDHLRTLYVLNFWKERATAYDLVGYAAARRIREQRALALEDSQFIKLSKFADRVFKRIEGFTEEDFESVDPLTATKILKDLVGLQRISVGLPANGPASEHLPGQKDSDASTSVEDHLRVVAKKKLATTTQDTAELLADETTTALAQELTMRLLRGDTN